MNTQHQRRRGMTLVELLVVITIILILSAIAVMAIPSVQDRNMQNGANQLQGWLLIAKQRAKRDGLPTGLRIMFDPTTKQATQCFYIQQPNDYDVPGTTCTGVGNNTVTFANGLTPLGAPAVVDLVGAGVQPGDYLEVYRGGGVYQITSVTGNTVQIAVTGPSCLSATSNPNGITAEYRIRRQPILLAGEPALTLPDGVVIDNTGSTSLNIPVRTVATDPNSPYYEVLFSPQGGLVGRGSGGDHLCVLWLINTVEQNTPPLLVALQSHTGFIAVQTADTASGDPYSFCRNGRSSGF
jgi:prepilin-type N-terminal cleavage/methylation domain-containing protein